MGTYQDEISGHSRKWVTQKEVDRLRKAAKSTRQALRNELLLVMLYRQGFCAKMPFLPLLTLKAQKPIHGLPKELKTIGDYIRAKRLKSTEPLKEVAGKIGVNQWTLMNWEGRRTKNIAAKYYPRIMEYLNYCPLVEEAEIKTKAKTKTFGQRIKLHRLHLGMNQKQFAQYFSVSPDSVANWENTNKKASMETNKGIEVYDKLCYNFKKNKL